MICSKEVFHCLILAGAICPKTNAKGYSLLWCELMVQYTVQLKRKSIIVLRLNIIHSRTEETTICCRIVPNLVYTSICSIETIPVYLTICL